MHALSGRTVAAVPIENASIDAPIVDPWSAEGQQKKKLPKKGFSRRAKVLASVLGGLAILGGGAIGIYTVVTHEEPAQAKEDLGDNIARDEVVRRRETAGRDIIQPPKADPPPTPQRKDPLSAQGSVPHDTTTTTIGSLQIVEVGVSATSLRETFDKQQKLAKERHKEVMVLTTRGGCDPCEAVIKSLSDPRMQEALDPVIILRVDTQVFEKELETLRIPTDHLPGFFLLKQDLKPRDSISGGEWDADIPENIAPVLGPFVRGQLTKRREKEWKPPPVKGTFL